jgi:hypothetical protein
MKQTDANVVEYLSAVNQFAEDNKTHKPKQQTAVEWLYKHLFPKQLDGFSDEEWKKIDTAFEQAKSMEKEQMIKFANECLKNYLSVRGYKTPEQYYNETYKNK